MNATANPDAARRAIAEHPAWYHTIELAPGVATPGFSDLRALAPRALPETLAGKRCLDVGTFDGFWAFEMERRGPSEVVAIDLARGTDADWPPNTRAQNERAAAESGAEWGRGFALASEALGSSVRRVPLSVYDLAPDRIGGTVDFALCGTLLQHLRDPVAALERIHETLVPGGEALLIETYSAPLTRRHRSRPVGEFRPAVPGSLFTWWVPNLFALRGWASTAGFEEVAVPVTSYKPGKGAGRDDRLAAIALRRA
jgi:tRNA (mo5U34)-methyltransferase